MPKKYCAFIDILGSKREFVDPLRGCQEEETTKKALEEYKGLMDRIFNNLSGHKGITDYVEMDEDMKWMAVSDSIIISCNSLNWMMLCCAEVQRQLLHLGLLARGGIGYGYYWDHWEDRKCYILSTAFVDACLSEGGRPANQEERLKGWPRILLHHAALSLAYEEKLFSQRSESNDQPWIIGCSEGGLDG